MPLTPEEIEARRFRLAQNGYDCESVDRFLAEIANALRTPTPSSLGADEFGRLGQEIAAILRNARDSAGAVRAEAEGHAAALRSRAELQASDVQKAAEAEAEALRAEVAAEADQARTQARQEAEAVRAAAQADADQIRLDAERQLEQATQARARADEQVAAIRAGAEREAAARVERAEHEARRRADEITTEATQRAEAIRESEQSTYLRLLAARDDLQLAIDRLVAGLEGDIRPGADLDPADEDQSVVDLTKAPAQVHPGPNAETAEAAAFGDATSFGDAVARASRPIASVGLDPAGSAGTGDPLLRMVRAAVGRAAEGSSTDDPEQEASAS